jgi:hypothetical protein
VHVWLFRLVRLLWINCSDNHPSSLQIYINKCNLEYCSIYIRENSLEYNQPIITPSKSTNTLTTLFCCGHSPSDLTVRDSISVIYYDDILFDTVRNDTPKCHECSTFCCGGKGEVVRLESTYCGDLCYRGRGGCSTCCLVPVCCPECICPCGVRVSFFPLYIAFAQFRRHWLMKMQKCMK